LTLAGRRVKLPKQTAHQSEEPDEGLPSLMVLQHKMKCSASTSSAWAALLGISRA